MKVVVIGGRGTIGGAIVKELGSRHEIVICGRAQGEIRLDITSLDSIRACFQKIGSFDAVVIAAGEVHFEEFAKMDAAKYEIGLKSKLMGQVNTVLIGKELIREGGSFTLTSGILSDDPIVAGSSASMVSGAIDSFVKAAAIEMPRSIRINAVNPTVLIESMDTYGPFFRGFVPVSAAKAALGYSKSVEGRQTGQVYRVWG